MFESVIVPLDGATRDRVALAMADAVAMAAGCPVELVQVAYEDQAAEAKRGLDEVAERLQSTVSRREVVAHAAVVEAILGEQDAHPASLVCMATHARTGAAELLIGSHAGALLRTAVRPLLLVGPRAEVPAELGVVLTCLDGSSEAEAILPAAESWARALGGRLRLVQVARPGAVRGPEELGQLQRAASHLRGGVDVDWDLLHGKDVAHTVVDHARELPASIIAMSTHGRSGATERLLGSVTMRVAHDASVPVLVQRTLAAGHRT